MAKKYPPVTLRKQGRLRVTLIHLLEDAMREIRGALTATRKTAKTEVRTAHHREIPSGA